MSVCGIIQHKLFKWKFSVSISNKSTHCMLTLVGVDSTIVESAKEAWLHCTAFSTLRMKISLVGDLKVQST